MPRPISALVGLIAALTALLGACSSNDASSGTDKDSPDSTDPVESSGAGMRSVVFDGGDDDIDTFRIPGAVTSSAGTILVFAEARSESPHDLDPRRIVVRRSTDAGATWGPIIPIVDPSVDPECDHTDPTPVGPTVGDGADDVLVLFRSCGQLGSSRSSDDGVSWSDRENLDFKSTGDLTDDVAGRLRSGPAHGIELTTGDAAGRLVFSTDITQGGETLTQLILSDDGGLSWRIGAHHRSDDAAGPNPDETAITELVDGTILLSARNGSADTPGRIQMRSTDGGETFADQDGQVMVIASELTVPVVQGSLLTEPTSGLAIFSSPSDPVYRRGPRLWTSSDGNDWELGPLLSQNPAAYSDLVALPDGDNSAVGVIVETGDRGLYERIEFVRIPVPELTDGPFENLEDDFDVAGAVSGRVVVDGTSFEIIEYCIGAERMELDGGWIEPDLSAGLDDVGFRAHLDDRGDGTPLDLDGRAQLELESGIRFRGQVADLEGVAHDVDLVMVNMEPCPG